MKVPFLAVGLAVCFAAGAAFSLPTGFKKTVLVTGGLNPVSLTSMPDGRLLVVEKHGVIRILDRDGHLLPTPFLDWSKNTIDSDEKGMMSVMLHPDFASNGFVFVQYSNNREFKPNGRDQISRFHVVGNAADPASEEFFFSLGNSGPNYHHGGGMAIGPDGKMYVACGNRNNESANGGSADKNAILGKILRLNVDGSIPSDNPFYATNTGDARAVWSYGHRNPFSFSWIGNRMFLNDVMDDKGDDEMNEVIKGEGYGYGGGGTHQALYHASGIPNYTPWAMVGALGYTGTQFPEKWRNAFFFGGEAEADRRIHVFHPDATGAARFEEFDQGAQAGNDGSECPISYAMDVVGSLYTATRCLTRHWLGGKVIKFTYGDPPPWPSTSALAGAEARKALRWAPLPGAVSVDLLQDVPGQSLELRDLEGRLVASLFAARAAKGLRLATGGAHGVHLLTWKAAGRSATAKLIL